MIDEESDEEPQTSKSYYEEQDEIRKKLVFLFSILGTGAMPSEFGKFVRYS